LDEGLDEAVTQAGTETLPYNPFPFKRR